MENVFRKQDVKFSNNMYTQSIYKYTININVSPCLAIFFFIIIMKSKSSRRRRRKIQFIRRIKKNETYKQVKLKVSPLYVYSVQNFGFNNDFQKLIVYKFQVFNLRFIFIINFYLFQLFNFFYSSSSSSSWDVLEQT